MIRKASFWFLTTYSSVICFIILFSYWKHHLESYNPLFFFFFQNMIKDDQSFLDTNNDLNHLAIHSFFDEKSAMINFWRQKHVPFVLIEQVIDNDYQLDPALVFSLVWKESRFRPNAIGYNAQDNSRDYGFFQLNNKVYADYHPHELLNINTNISLGLKHLHDAMSFWEGNVLLGLKTYNAGYSRVKNNRYPVSTYHYAQDILILKKQWTIELRWFLEKEKILNYTSSYHRYLTNLGL